MLYVKIIFSNAFAKCSKIIVRFQYLTMDDKAYTEQIIKIGLNGESVRGNNGAVLIDEENNEMVYLLSHEFKPQDFCDKLSDLLSEDGNDYMYIVHKTKDAMHISKIPRGI